MLFAGFVFLVSCSCMLTMNGYILCGVYSHVVFMNSLQMHRNVGNDSQILGSLTVPVIEDY